MKHSSVILLLLAIFSFQSCQKSQEENVLELWYNKPAEIWEEALPIGNGRIGAMIYGEPVVEKIQFNEETLWDCAPRDYFRDDAHEYLDDIRTLLFAGKQREAEKLGMETFMGRRAFEETFPLEKEHWVDSILQLDIIEQAVLPSYDDTPWPDMNMDYKSVWETKGHPDMNGAVLFRKTMEIPETWMGKDLYVNLGRIKDQDFCYFNGKLIGSKDESNTNRTYKIPSHLVKEGENVIAVLINNYVSTGGFNAVRNGTKKMHILPFGQMNDPVFIEGKWKYKIIDTNPPSYPQYEAEYQPFGTVELEFDGIDEVSQYRRSLDLNHALAKTSFVSNGVRYSRKYLASAPDSIIVMHLSADKKGEISFKAAFQTLHLVHSSYKVDDRTLALNVKVSDGEMKATAYLTVSCENGELVVSDSSIFVRGADEATIKLIAETNYVSFNDISGNPVKRCDKRLDVVRDRDFASIKKAHVEDFKALYDRFSISLGDETKRSVSTDERIMRVKDEEDRDLIATYVQYARYLMLSSGRSGTNPPNLQGIWNEKIFPPWGSKYTTNINCEMNFWPVEALNIAECHASLFKLIEEVAVEGALTAENHYKAGGWVLHHNTDQWRGTAPINNSNHGIWVTGGAWLCHHMWEHYLYSGDTVFLREQAYPLIKGAAQFFVDFLIEDPKTGFLISTPSNSPENGGLVAGPAMDHQIIRSLFKVVLKCSEILETDQDFAILVKEKLSQMAPDQIGRLGQLQEWMDDIDDPGNHHRHVSHLWGVHPGNEINWESSPELMQAAIKSLEMRGDEGTGWSLAWKINLWARFLDGDHANGMVRMLLSSAVDRERASRGGSYPNLFDAHPPFQIDGNFGGAAGIIEMLMQSHQGYVHILPALPSTWTEGSIEGLRCRGGFELSMEWKEGELVLLKVKSTQGNELHIKYKDKTLQMETEAGEEYDVMTKLTRG